MTDTDTTVIELSPEQLQWIMQFLEAQAQDSPGPVIKSIVEAYVCLVVELSKKRVNIRRLQRLLFGARTEKTATVLRGQTGVSPATPPEETSSAEASVPSTETPPEQHKGHGRRPAGAYRGAAKTRVPHPTLHVGDACPDCEQGILYELSRAKVLVRFTGQAPVQAQVYELQRLRCNLCGKIFTAPTPEGVGMHKYDATTASMIGLLKYGSGFPFNRLARLQRMCDIPLSASTQWDIIDSTLPQLEPAHDELIRQAAQGEVVYNDDTTVRILECMGKRAQRRAAAAPPSPELGAEKEKNQRTGLFTSGIISTGAGHQIALFFSGRQHAGENLEDVLRQRAADLESPIQMCDALSRNLPKSLRTIVAHCLAHGRRQFLDVVADFPDECRHVLETLKTVYQNDALTKQRYMSAEERLSLHQAQSGPLMTDLEQWLRRQLDERWVEPNSALGEAIAYMLKHWDRLTLFLHRAGAPLDNNLVERALKKAILHRKGSLFFRSEHGAHAGDVFMSLIYTCELCGANAFDYLTELQRHAGELAAHPQNWMPWNYRETLAAALATFTPVAAAR
jgi:hypothetical protein